MKLYDYRLAPNPRRVRIFLAEKKIEIPRVEIDIASQAHRTPEFLALNPAGTVPVLELDDGTAIAESVAICRYLEALSPEPPLFGSDRLSSARIEMWHRRVELELMVPVQHAVRNSHPVFATRGHGEGGAQSRDFVESGRRVAAATCDWLDRELATRRFVVGDAFSVADIALLVAIDFARLAELRLREGRPHLDRWYAEVAARPSAGA
jgi:glutathione S-transferase